ncbi:MAG: sporulation protein YqfD [Erysipelotrichaceae bacterium]
MSYKHFGLDSYRLDYDVSSFIQIVSKQEWTIYDVEYKDEITFYTSVYNRKDIINTFHNIKLLKTTGWLGFLIRFYKKPVRFFSLCFMICIWYGLSNTIFKIDIIGERIDIQQQIKEVLTLNHLSPPFFHKDVIQIKELLKKQCESDLAWLEVIKRGSRYIIYYTPKETVKIESLSNQNLIAQRDGIIAGFNLKWGNKLCKINDFVHQGDVLVNNVLLDSMNKEEPLYVLGNVFAYSWQRVEVSMNQSHLPKAFEFFQLLFLARNQVSKDFRANDKIHKENILQFSQDMGKIKMVVLYTTYLDISTPMGDGG